jgi:hypothetical protein
VDNGWLNLLGGTLQTAANYAMVRDQQQMAVKNGYTMAATPLAPTAQAAAAMANSRLMLLGLIGVGLVFATRGK